MYINTTTLTVHSEQDIRAANPNTSYPVPFISPEGYAYVFPAPSNHDPVTQVVVPAAPELTVLGHWEQRWAVTDKSAEVIAAEAEVQRLASIPASVTRRQAVRALILTGKRNLVQPALDAIPNTLQRELMQAEWDESQEFERNRPSLIALGTAIGLSSSEIDDLFILAATQ